MTKNQLQYHANLEIARHNLAQESEANRHNVRTEAQDDRKLSETERHNYRTEGQEDRRQTETERYQKYKNATDAVSATGSLLRGASSFGKII